MCAYFLFLLCLIQLQGLYITQMYLHPGQKQIHVMHVFLNFCICDNVSCNINVNQTRLKHSNVVCVHVSQCSRPNTHSVTALIGVFNNPLLANQFPSQVARRFWSCFHLCYHLWEQSKDSLMRSLTEIVKAGHNTSSQSHEECIQHHTLMISNCVRVFKGGIVL